MNQFACFDIGGTTIKYGMIDEKEQLRSVSETPTDAYLGGTHILETILKITKEFVDIHDIRGVCISTAGMVDSTEGKIVFANSNIPDYSGINFKKAINEKFCLPCTVENDVYCAGIAEATSGAGKECNPVCCLTIGTGIGGCLVIDGKVYRGFSNSACEVGYMNINNDWYERQCSVAALSKKVAAAKQMNEGNGQVIWDGKRILDSAKEGDEICIKALDEMTDLVGKGIANICYVLNPEVVVIGGGIMRQEDYILPRIKAGVQKYLIPQIANVTKIRTAYYSNNAGMMGAYFKFRGDTSHY